jgi:hypothetical protein
MIELELVAGLAPGFRSPDWNQAAPLGDPGMAIDDAEYRDAVPAHFHLRQGGTAVLCVACTIAAAGVSFHRWPLTLAVADGVADDVAHAAVERALDHLAAMGRPLWILGGCPMLEEPSPTLVDSLCAARGGIAVPRVHAVADLALDADHLRRDLRKSFRSLVNWSGRNLTLRHGNRQTWDDRVWTDFIAFYSRIAGHTKPADVWNAIAASIRDGFGGEVTVGEWNGAMVAGMVVLDGRSVACYTLGAYERSLFDKPLAHGPLFLAMLNARARGLRWFDLGHIPAEGAASPKEVNIGYFKRGFTSRFVTTREWRLGQR